MTAGDGPLVAVTRHGAVAVVQLRREAKLNALSAELEGQLLDAVRGPEVTGSRAVLLTGGDRVFSSGADVTELAGRSPAEVFAYYRSTGHVYEAVAGLPQPSVSAINGYCLGGGLELALATDFRVAAADAVFGFPEVGLGIVPSSGGLHRLVRTVGAARARELVLARPRIGAPEADALGLLTEVCAPGVDPLARALELADALASLPPLAASLALQAIDAAGEASREAALLIERLCYATLAQQPPGS